MSNAEIGHIEFSKPDDAEVILKKLQRFNGEARAAYFEGLKPEALRSVLERVCSGRTSEGLREWLKELKTKDELERDRRRMLLTAAEDLAVEMLTPKLVQRSALATITKPDDVAIFSPFGRQFLLYATRVEEVWTPRTPDVVSSFTFLPRVTYERHREAITRGIERTKAQMRALRVEEFFADIFSLGQIQDLTFLERYTIPAVNVEAAPGVRGERREKRSPVLGGYQSGHWTGLDGFVGSVQCPMLLTRWLEHLGGFANDELVINPTVRAVDRQIGNRGGRPRMAIAEWRAFWREVADAPKPCTDVPIYDDDGGAHLLELASEQSTVSA